MNIGLFFGTYNPIHVGHLIIANYLVNSTDLDQIWLVVSPQNPLKNKKTILDDYQRLHMVNLAIKGNDDLRASDIEFALSKPSYTVNTLAYLKEKFPKHNFSLILGEDNLRTFHKWFNYEYILENYKMYVYPRNVTTQEHELNKGSDSKAFYNEIIQHKNVILCTETPIMKISSGFIRDEIKAGHSVKYMLTDAVYQYVDEMNFYK